MCVCVHTVCVYVRAHIILVVFLICIPKHISKPINIQSKLFSYLEKQVFIGDDCKGTYM